ncbi:MAG: AGE family epimerase/isomerase, partial [Phenylobacterium sp.]|nr:AGE family epimerase/isomerase [Phenylobacterium sp.]
PSSAMGYVVPADAGEVVGPIGTFVEKPEVVRAAALIADGALWNAGIFIARANVLVETLRRHAPEIETAVSRAVKESRPDGVRTWLGAGFADAPIQPFDRAVMETTDRGAVLPVDFAWSDIGAWDAVLAASSRDASGSSLEGDVQMREGHGMLVRAAPGMRVVVAGVEGLAVVAQPDAVLVCRLDQAQDLRGLGRSGPPLRFVDLPSASAALSMWLSTAALPLWGTVGVSEPSGLFVEAMTGAGAPHDPRCRTRVQARQAFVFASAETEGRAGPWGAVARRGLAAFQARMTRPDGLFATSITSEGGPLDPEARLYEHAFVLLALSALGDIAAGRRLLAALQVFRHPAGGFREAGERPFQANAHMHLLEAALAWEAVDDHQPWRDLADEIVALAMARFIAPDTGALSEFFDAEWTPLRGEAARVEPGHQFEWAWLLADWGRRRRDPRADAVARGLYKAGRCGVDPRRGVAVNLLAPDLSLLDPAARLWPQTEYLKAALSLGEPEHALEAANTIAWFVETPVRGIWRERMFADGAFVDEPSPATSLYHLYQAIRELGRAAPVAC